MKVKCKKCGVKKHCPLLKSLEEVHKGHGVEAMIDKCQGGKEKLNG